MGGPSGAGEPGPCGAFGLGSSSSLRRTSRGRSASTSGTRALVAHSVRNSSRSRSVPTVASMASVTWGAGPSGELSGAVSGRPMGGQCSSGAVPRQSCWLSRSIAVASSTDAVGRQAHSASRHASHGRRMTARCAKARNSTQRLMRLAAGAPSVVSGRQREPTTTLQERTHATLRCSPARFEKVHPVGHDEVRKTGALRGLGPRCRACNGPLRRTPSLCRQGVHAQRWRRPDADGADQHCVSHAVSVTVCVNGTSPCLYAGGVQVTFVAPSNGASGTFADTGTNTTTVVSDSRGVATAPIFSANGTAGTYTVTAVEADRIADPARATRSGVARSRRSG